MNTSSFNIPDHMMAALLRYMNDGVEPGDFLSAVIRNDLSEAVSRADSTNIQIIPEYVRYLYNEAPQGCWGSESKFKDWIRARAEDRAYDQLVARNHGHVA